MVELNDIRSRVAELLAGSRDEEPEPQGFQGEERSVGLIRGGALEHDPPRDDLNFYRQLYENVGPIKTAIDNYASEVIEPGWYITADNQETADQLTEYFRNVAILNTNTNVNASSLIEEMVREREIKGTIFLEKVQDSDGRNQALYPLQNDTISIYTKPGKAMLPAPDDEAAEPFDAGMEREVPPLTEDGEMGAYVQFDEIKPRWAGTDEQVFTRNQIIKWVRDAPMGEPRGTSRIASSAQRAEGLLEKLQDNDDAVKFKAWPQIIFELGDEDNPWNEDEVKNFIDNYSDDKMSPGLMHAVAGDVDVEEFAGDTADIHDTLNFDISMIMSGLPGPVYATGGFAQNVAPAVAEAQQRQFIKEVKKTRRELENMFTPYLQEVAEDYGLDGADSVQLHITRPNGQVAPEDIEGNIIQYNSSVNQDGQGQDQPTQTDQSNQDDNQNGDSQNEARGAAAPQPGDATQAPQTTTEDDTDSPGSASGADFARTESSSGVDSVADVAEVGSSFRFGHQPQTEGLDEDELADPRLVSTRSIENELADIIYDELLTARETIADRFEDTADRPLRNADEIVASVTRAVRDEIDDASIDARSRPHVEDTIESTLSTLRQDNHTPSMEVELSARHRQRSRLLSNDIATNVENTVDDLQEFVEVNARQAVQHGENPSVVAERLRKSYDDDTLRNRARTMATIEIKSAVNSVKLTEYDRHDDIVGVKLINPCNTNTTPLCQQLACDMSAEAMFDANQTLGEQFESEVNDAFLFDGFDPLPTVPPFHFNCRTEIVPVTDTNE